MLILVRIARPASIPSPQSRILNIQLPLRPGHLAARLLLISSLVLNPFCKSPPLLDVREQTHAYLTSIAELVREALARTHRTTNATNMTDNRNIFARQRRDTEQAVGEAVNSVRISSFPAHCKLRSRQFQETNGGVQILSGDVLSRLVHIVLARVRGHCQV